MNAISFTATKPVHGKSVKKVNPSARKPAGDTEPGKTRSAAPKSKGMSNFDLTMLALAAAALGGMVGVAGNSAALQNSKPDYFDYNALEVEEIGEEQSIEEKREQQAKVADVYKDGDTIYYTITAEDGITVAEFSKLFDVPIEALAKSNNLDATYVKIEPDEYGISGAYGVEDDTLEKGTLVKVNLGDILKPDYSGMSYDNRGLSSTSE